MARDIVITLIGVVIGVVFGVSAISTLVNMLQSSVSMLSTLGAPSSMWLLVSVVVAILFIVYVRVLAGLMTGIVLGVLLNMLSMAYCGQDIVSLIHAQDIVSLIRTMV